MINNNFCDLDKLMNATLAYLGDGKLGEPLTGDKNLDYLFSGAEAQPSTTTTKGVKKTKGKGKAKEAPAVDPKVAQLRSDYEALNAIQHERDLQYRELQAENKLLIKALQDKKAKQTAEAKLAYEKRKAERTPEQQAKIDAQTQKMLDGAKKAREAKKAQEAINPSGNKTVAGIIKQAIKKKKDKAEIDAEIQRKQDLKDATEAKYKGDALKAKLEELQDDPVALENAKQAMEDDVPPQTPDELLANLLVKSQAERKKSETWEIAKGIADYNRDIKNAPKKKQVQARKDLLATTDAQYKGDALQAKLKEIKANEEAMANAKKQIKANEDPTTPEELLAHNLVKQAENKSKIKPKIKDLSKGFSEFANNERLAPKREVQALFNTKQQELRNEINQAFPDGKGGIDKKALQEHLQEMRDDKALLEKARNEVKNKQAPYSMESYLSHEIVKKLDAKKKELKEADATIKAVRKALKKTQDPDALREKLRRKQAIENFEADIAEKYDTVDKLKKAVQAVKDNPDLLEETRKLIADGGFPTTVEQYIAMHQLKRGAKEMPNKPSDLSKALTSVNREPNAPATPETLQARAKKKLEKQQKLLRENTALLEDLKAGEKAGYLSELQKKRFNAILNKENKTDLEKELIALSQELGKERSKISKDQADLVLNSLQNKENLTKDERTVLNAILATNAKKLEQVLTNQQAALEAKTAELARLKAKAVPIDLPKQLFGKLLKKENALAKKTPLEKQLLEISKEIGTEKAKMSKEHANVVADALKNKENLTPDEQKVLDGIVAQEKKALAKKLDNYLIEKVPNATPRMRKSVVDRIMELQADGRTLTPEQFKIVLKQELVPSGVTVSFQNKLKRLQSELDAVKGKDFDAEMRKQSEINYELATLIPATLGGQFSKAFNIATLGTLKSAEKDYVGGFLNTLIDSDAVNSPKKALEVTRKFFSPILDLGKASKGEGFYKLVKDAFDGTLNLDSEGLRLNSRKWKFDSPNHPVSKALFPTMHFLERVLNVRLSAPDALWFTHMYEGKKEALVKQNNGKELTYEQHKQAFMDAERALLRDDNIYTQWVKNIQSEGNIASLAVWRMLLNKPVGVDDKKGTPIFFKRGKESVPEFGAGTLLNPFVKFSTNALLQAVHLSGVLPLKDIVVDAGKNTVKLVKNFNPKQAEKELMSWSDTQKSSATFVKKALPLHVAMAILGITGGYFGIITGGYSRKTKDENQAEGTPEDSIIMGDLAVPYGQIFPLAPPLKAYSYIGRVLAGKEPPIWSEWDSIASGVDSLFTALNRGTENTIASSLEALIRESSTGGGSNIVKGVVATGANAGVSFIPSIVKDTLNLFAPEKIETKGADPLETLANKAGDKFKLGYLAGDKKAVKRDITGKLVNDADPNPLARAVSFLMNPYGAKIAKADPVIKELRKVSREAGVDVQLKQVDNSFEIGKELAHKYKTEPQNMKLNAQDFAKWQEIHNNMVYQSVKTVLDSEKYKNSSAVVKAKRIENAKEKAYVQIGDKKYTPKMLFLEYKLKGRVVNINR